jgi:hypothetical protein
MAMLVMAIYVFDFAELVGVDGGASPRNIVWLAVCGKICHTAFRLEGLACGKSGRL